MTYTNYNIEILILMIVFKLILYTEFLEIILLLLIELYLLYLIYIFNVKLRKICVSYLIFICMNNISIILILFIFI